MSVNTDFLKPEIAVENLEVLDSRFNTLRAKSIRIRNALDRISKNDCVRACDIDKCNEEPEDSPEIETTESDNNFEMELDAVSLDNTNQAQMNEREVEERPPPLIPKPIFCRSLSKFF
jgi:nucleotidyltransferase/DNA polymerase involved in DNA repair